MRDELITAAIEARDKAYAPYSNYKVGAAVLGNDGRVYSGCNVENASYGLTMCAERNAVGAMIAAGCKRLSAVAVATQDGAAPCGACLQVLAEFSQGTDEIPIFLIGKGHGARRRTLARLYPNPFSTKRAK